MLTGKVEKVEGYVFGALETSIRNWASPAIANLPRETRNQANEEENGKKEKRWNKKKAAAAPNPLFELPPLSQGRITFPMGITCNISDDEYNTKKKTTKVQKTKS